MSDIQGLDPAPTGPWWKRVVEALKIAVENVRQRRTEAWRDGVHLIDDLEDLATKDDRKGKP